MFSRLFETIKINKTTIKNRIVYPSLALSYSDDRKLNDRYLDYYREKAKGGAGIVTVGPVLFDNTGTGVITPSIADDESVPSFSRLASVIKDEGACAWMQLYHAGAYSYSSMMDGMQPIAPSSLYSKYSKETPREMTIDDIISVQESFIKGAERAKEAGFDGVELLGSAGYLITQFLSPLKNIRTDQYGGSFENRTRFVRELIEKMRKRLGPDYPITIRMAGNDFVPGSTTDNDTPMIAKVYELAGIDAISVTGGWHESLVPQLAMNLPRGGFTYLAETVKAAVTIPVIASNRISDPFLAEQIIKDGYADMVNLGRVLIADPYWPQKARNGSAEEIRPCVACSQGCTDEFFSGRPVICLANARAGFEGERNISHADSPKRVMVIGAGPGGLEAAYRAAEAGHVVDLYEKNDDIGGQIWIAGTPPHKHELHELIRYYNAMIGKYKVNLHIGTEVTTELIDKVKPDFIISAEGAAVSVPPIDGMSGEAVISAWDVLENDPPLGKRIAVIGGGAVGLETAEFLAEKGTIDPETLYFLFKYRAESDERLHELMRKGTKDITIFEMQPKAGKDVGKSTKWILLANIENFDVKIITSAKVKSVKNNTVIYEKDGKLHELEFDSIINAAGSKPVRKIADKLKDTEIQYEIIGDSVRPATILQAIHEGFLAAMKIR
ncbi:MAG TPA: FAD-dependent oxidoreductase [Spirochaetota bacterium]|nr:FAD-dependent oxidoreductase [Spirochaetota bacterium]